MGARNRLFGSSKQAVSEGDVATVGAQWPVCKYLSRLASAARRCLLPCLATVLLVLRGSSVAFAQMVMEGAVTRTNV